MKRLLDGPEQAIAIEKPAARNQRLAPIEPGGDFEEGLGDSGVDGVRS